MAFTHWVPKPSISAVTAAHSLVEPLSSYFLRLRLLYATLIAVYTLHCVAVTITTLLLECALSSRDPLCTLLLLLLIKLPWPTQPISAWPHLLSLTLSIQLRLSRAMSLLCMRVLLQSRYQRHPVHQRLRLRQHRVL
jgi:hypothetical protein